MKQRMAAICAVVTAVLAGCSGIPDSGPVLAGQVPQAEDPGDLEFLPEGPREGATPEELVAGFLQAAISPGDDFAIAREYLCTDAAAAWDPTTGVTVRSGQPQLSSTGDGRAIEATIDVVGRLDGQGLFTEMRDASVRLPFEMAERGGRWCIASAPDGIVLTRYFFQALFDMQELQWFTPDGVMGVRDVRWFERSGDTLAARIVDAVLAGPAPWLADAVRSAGNPGVTRVGAVELDGDGSATVTVSGDQLASSTPEQASRLAQQLASALRLAGITTATVLIEGAPEDYPVADSALAPALGSTTIDSRPLVLRSGVLDRVGSGQQTTLDTGPALERLQASSYAVDVDTTLGVALAAGRVVRLGEGGVETVLAEGVTVPPSLDRHGWAWWVSEQVPGAIMASNGTTSVVLELPDTRERVVGIDVSREGARLAVVTALGDETHAWAYGIARDADGRPQATGEPYRLGDIAGAAVDVTWSDDTEVAVLTNASSTSAVVNLTIGGEAEQLPALPQSVAQVVGGSEGAPSLRALTADGRLLAPRGGAWQSVVDVEDVRLIATQI